MKIRKRRLAIATLLIIMGLVSCYKFSTYARVPENSIPFSVDAAIEDSIADQETKYYKIEVKKSGRLVVRCSYNYALKMKLHLDAFLSEIYHNAIIEGDEDKIRDSYIFYVNAGTYYIGVDAANGAGTFILENVFIEIDETFPETSKDNSIYETRAHELPFNKIINGIVAEGNRYSECDFYKVTLKSDGYLNLSGKAIRKIIGNRYVLVYAKYTIFDEKMNKVWVGESKEYQKNDECYSYCSGRVKLKKGTYYLRIGNKETDLGFEYRLKAKVDYLVSGVSINRKSLSLDLLGTRTSILKATISPSNVANKKLKWTSSNTRVAKVSSDGKVTAVGVGTATIYAKATDGSGKKASCKVSVKGDSGITYSTHVQSYGWQNWKNDGTMAGTSGEAKRLEGIKIKISNKRYSGGIRYTTHVQSYGWLGNPNNSASWEHDGQISGTTGQGKRLEAIKIKLYGDMAKHYDVYYRVHAQSYGWLGWAKNGESAGTSGKAKRLEAIQIVLVRKGGNTPANTYKGVTGNTSKAFIQ